MVSSDILANWISVGDRMYQRSEVYGATWCSDIMGSGSPPNILVSASFGGPILAVRPSHNIVQVFRASGSEISHFRWRNAAVVDAGWSHTEELVFVVEDGTVLTYNIFGEFIGTVSMGQEAKDVRIKDARVFRTGEFGMDSTGVAVFTTSHRLFDIYCHFFSIFFDFRIF